MKRRRQKHVVTRRCSASRVYTELFKENYGGSFSIRYFDDHRCNPLVSSARALFARLACRRCVMCDMSNMFDMCDMCDGCIAGTALSFAGAKAVFLRLLLQQQQWWLCLMMPTTTGWCAAWRGNACMLVREPHACFKVCPITCEVITDAVATKVTQCQSRAARALLDIHTRLLFSSRPNDSMKGRALCNGWLAVAPAHSRASAAPPR